MAAVITLVFFAGAFVLMAYTLSCGGNHSCKGCIYNKDAYLLTTMCSYHKKEHLIIVGCMNWKSRTMARKETERRKNQ